MILTRQTIEQLRFPCWLRRFYRAEKVDVALDEIAAAAEEMQKEIQRLREAEAAAHAENARLAAEAEKLRADGAEACAALDDLARETEKLRAENQRLQRSEAAVRTAYQSVKASEATRDGVARMQTAVREGEQGDAYSRDRKQPFGMLAAEERECDRELWRSPCRTKQTVCGTERAGAAEMEERREARLHRAWKRSLRIKERRQ